MGMAHVTDGVMDDRVDPARAAALIATLGRDDDVPGVGDALLPFFHQIYFWEAPRQLGPDGHASHPDDPGLFRMWAGGRVQFHKAFCAGIAARKASRVKTIAEKEGKSGPLTFVTLSHTVQQRGQPVLTEEQTLVYRQDRLARPAPPTRRPRHSDTQGMLQLSEGLLFRYSALTFNAHRIHYDADYCRDVAGYPGLVVHGPLLAQYLALALHDRLGPLTQFSYRAEAPLFLGTEAFWCAAGQDAWVEDAMGRICMTAAAQPR